MKNKLVYCVGVPFALAFTTLLVPLIFGSALLIALFICFALYWGCVKPSNWVNPKQTAKQGFDRFRKKMEE